MLTSSWIGSGFRGDHFGYLEGHHVQLSKTANFINTLQRRKPWKTMVQGQVKKTGGSQLVKQHKKAQTTKLSKGGTSPTTHPTGPLIGSLGISTRRC